MNIIEKFPERVDSRNIIFKVILKKFQYNLLYYSSSY